MTANYFTRKLIAAGFASAIAAAAIATGATSASATGFGVGELQECTISKSADSASATPAFSRYGKDGAKGGNVEFEWKLAEHES